VIGFRVIGFLVIGFPVTEPALALAP